MAYKPNIPAATDKLSVSQSDLQGNFQAIDDGTASPGVGYGYDHITLAAASDVGKHKKVTFVEQSAAPTITSTDSALYTLDGGSGFSHLYFANSSASYDLSNGVSESAANVSQITFNTPSLFTADKNWQYKVGITTGAQVTVGLAINILYPTAFSATTLSVLVTPILPLASTTKIPNLTVVSFDKSGFTVFLNSVGTVTTGAININYMAIGR